MAPIGYLPNYKYLADSAELNSYTGAGIKNLGFSGVLPYIGIGGGPTLPNKRLTAARYWDYRNAGLDIPGAFIEFGTNDADSGYNGGVANAIAGLTDLSDMGIDIPILIAVNDKTTYMQADIDYVRGFRDTVGYNRCGVYGFSGFLTAIHNSRIAMFYFQCGSNPIGTGTDSFVNVWQRNDGTVNNLDVNQVFITLSKQITNGDTEMAAIPFANPSNWLVWVCENGRLIDGGTSQQLNGNETWNGLPIGKLTPERYDNLIAMSNTVEHSMENPTSPATITVDSQAIGQTLKNIGTQMGA